MNRLYNTEEAGEKIDVAQRMIEEMGLVGAVEYGYTEEGDFQLKNLQKFSLDAEAFFAHFLKYPEGESLGTLETFYETKEVLEAWMLSEGRPYSVHFIIDEMYLDLSEEPSESHTVQNDEWFERNYAVYTKRGYLNEVKEIQLKQVFTEEEAKNQLWGLYVRESQKGAFQRKNIEMLLKNKLYHIFKELI